MCVIFISLVEYSILGKIELSYVDILYDCLPHGQCIRRTIPIMRPSTYSNTSMRHSSSTSANFLYDKYDTFNNDGNIINKLKASTHSTFSLRNIFRSSRKDMLHAYNNINDGLTVEVSHLIFWHSHNKDIS